MGSRRNNEFQTEFDEAIPVGVTRERAAGVPPRWFIRLAWAVHRGIYRFSRGRLGLSIPRPDGRYGFLRLTTVGRRSGEERVAILAYYEDGPNLVTLAMNGWADAEPAWWLNLCAQPNARIDLKGGVREVRARAAEGQERTRLWAMMRDSATGSDLDTFAAMRSSETAVVILEPR